MNLFFLFAKTVKKSSFTYQDSHYLASEIRHLEVTDPVRRSVSPYPHRNQRDGTLSSAPFVRFGWQDSAEIAMTCDHLDQRESETTFSITVQPICKNRLDDARPPGSPTILCPLGLDCRTWSLHSNFTRISCSH